MSASLVKKRKSITIKILKRLLHRLLVIFGAVFLTLGFFLILPLMQTLAKPPNTDLILQTIETAKLEAPEPPHEVEPDKEPEPEEQSLDLVEDSPPLDLSQLELALNPSFSDGMMSGDFAVNLKTIISADNSNVDALFSVADLDQEPRVIYQPSPSLTKEARRKTPGKVYVVFIVDQQGRVQDPIIQQSSDTVFEKAALNAVKQWKFEPGKRNGQAVRFRMRVPITFPKG